MLLKKELADSFFSLSAMKYLTGGDISNEIQSMLALSILFYLSLYIFLF